ncbi:flagellin [Thiorhodococcus fuscus]|uniref:Flagellin n=1 Tax=Thiorhodococcus fuscus TaxID=527200 RepID=A0ABW4Y5E0_9GAMM
MSLVINTNVASLNAQRNIDKSKASLSQSMERLSSGMRINSAKDDAAGSAIVSRLTSQIKGLDQAVRNANDGISLVQTAEGALSESSNILQRMRELAVQSANGTYTTGNRSTLNAETQQLVEELNRISTSTNFNGLNLLDGSSQEVKLQIGSDANQTIGVSIGKMDASSLGISDTAGVSSISRTGTAVAAGTTTAQVNAAISSAIGATTGGTTPTGALGTGDLIINGISIEGAVAAADNKSSGGNVASAIATAAAINDKSDQTGVTAVVGETRLGGSAMGTAAVTAVTGSITLNDVKINLSIGAVSSTSSQADNVSNRANIIKAINLESERTGVTASDSGSDNGGITLTAADGRNIVLINNTAALDGANTGLGGLGSAGAGATGSLSVTTGTVTLVAEGGKDISISSGATGKSIDAGFMEGTYDGNKTQVSSQLANSTEAMAAGNVFVNGVSVGPSYATEDTASSGLKEASAIAKAAAFNAVSDKTGVTAEVNVNRADNTAVQSTASVAVSGTINGVSITGFTTVAGANSANRQSLVSAINAVSGQTGVTAVDTGEDGSANGGGVQLVAEDGRNIIVSLSNGDAAGFSTNTTAAATDAQNFIGEFTLTSDKEIEITRGTDDKLAKSGLSVGNYGGGEDGQSIATIDISTVEGANKAIKAIDNALQQVNDTRSDLGAVNNRLDFTINNLSSISQNATASRSRIQDADFAAETANLSRSQVLQQASSAMLAQANSAPQQVLSLLR